MPSISIVFSEILALDCYLFAESLRVFYCSSEIKLLCSYRPILFSFSCLYIFFRGFPDF